MECLLTLPRQKGERKYEKTIRKNKIIVNFVHFIHGAMSDANTGICSRRRYGNHGS